MLMPEIKKVSFSSLESIAIVEGNQPSGGGEDL